MNYPMFTDLIIRQDMKNLLILIVAAALFLHFYPQPELEKWYNHHKNSIMSSVSNATDTRVRLNIKKVYSDLEALFNRFSPEEVEYVTEMASERDNIISFYLEHCEKHKPNFNLQSLNQKRVCKVIAQYKKFF